MPSSTLVREVPNPHPIGSSSGRRGDAVLPGILIAATALLGLGFVIGPRIMCVYGKSKEDIAALVVRRYTDDAIPLWRRDSPGRDCPSDLAELNVLVNIRAERPAPTDPWGSPYRFTCPADNPLGVRVSSAGPDRRVGTGDDIRSDE